MRRGTNRSRRAVVAFVLATLVIGACGDSDDDAGTGSGGDETSAPGGRLPVGKGVHGVTDDVIQIGMYTADAATGGKVTGAVAGGSTSAEDPDRFVKEVIGEVNKKGIAGRKVEAVWHFVDYNQFTTTAARQGEHQKMCTAWTEDKQVFAISGTGMMEDMIIDCAAKAKTPIIMSGYQPPVSKQFFDTVAPYWYSPNGMLTETRERAVVRFLHSSGYFTPGAKVGIVMQDTPHIKGGVERGMKPALSALGIEVAAEVAYSDPVSSPWSTYMLTMQQKGVTHVILSTSTAGSLPSTFLVRAANDAGYKPQWGTASDHTPDRLTQRNPVPEQLANMWAVGWAPPYDLGTSAPAGSPNDQLCRDIQKRVSYDSTGANVGNPQAFCDVMFFLQSAFEQAKEVSPEGLADGVAKLRTEWASALTVDGKTRFGKGDHEGPTVARLARYSAAEKRFTYTTEAKPLSTS